MSRSLTVTSTSDHDAKAMRKYACVGRRVKTVPAITFAVASSSSFDPLTCWF